MNEGHALNAANPNHEIIEQALFLDIGDLRMSARRSRAEWSKSLHFQRIVAYHISKLNSVREY
jgi:hypothetical protein